MARKKVVLAYSGGLDTSVILHWLKNKKGYDVVAFMANLGQNEDFEAARQKAFEVGASDFVLEDLKGEFAESFIFPALRANAVYEWDYLLGTSLARPLTAKAQVDVAKSVGATVLSHGSTDKGNDQVRFELAYRRWMPGVEIYAPWKKGDFRRAFKGGRDDMIEYSRANGIPITQTKRNPWSSDDNMWHISYEAGMLEDPAAIPLERMFQLTVSPQRAPNCETIVEIEFRGGNPVRVAEIKNWSIARVDKGERKKGVPYNIVCGKQYTDPVAIILYLNKLAGRNGVGRVDMVEDRFIGMKSRGVYETPAGTVLHFAHRDLERVVLSREISKTNREMMIALAEKIYNGEWFTEERGHLQECIDLTQRYVNGIVRVGLYKGNLRIRGREAVGIDSLYDEGMASMHEAGTGTGAEGFIRTVSRKHEIAGKRADTYGARRDTS